MGYDIEEGFCIDVAVHVGKWLGSRGTLSEMNANGSINLVNSVRGHLSHLREKRVEIGLNPDGPLSIANVCKLLDYERLSLLLLYQVDGEESVKSTILGHTHAAEWIDGFQPNTLVIFAAHYHAELLYLHEPRVVADIIAHLGKTPNANMSLAGDGFD